MDEQMPLHNAAEADDVVNIRRLVAEGADVNVAGDGGWRPLHEAAAEGHVEAVQVLVELGADKEASTAAGDTPLHWAAYAGHVTVVKTLVELGADIGALDGGAKTPLQLSIRFGHHHVERVLRGAMALERSARTKKEAEAKKPTQQAIDQAERNAAQLIEEEERDIAAQRKVRGCSTLTSPSSIEPGWMVCPSHTG
jgi:ankyrin repeat protein